MHKIFFLIVMMLCSFAYANENDNSVYKDWDGLVSQLRSKGIEPSKINWTSIGSVCAYAENKNPIEYNKCRFEKALDQNQYGNDSNYCNSRSQQKYFEFIKPSIAEVVVRNSKGEVISGTEERSVNLNKQESEEFRNSSFIECMHNAGWNNPSSWVNGRKEEKDR